MSHTGGCLCGDVRFTAELAGSSTGACHCDTCLSWAGGPFFGVRTTSIAFQSDATLRTYTSSEWAERGFCGTCGSTLFYRLTVQGPRKDETNIALGSLDDASGIELGYELFIDKKPGAYAFVGDHKRMTGDEVMGRAKG